MHWNVNENTWTKKISQVITGGLLSSNMEVKVGYGEDPRDDESIT